MNKTRFIHFALHFFFEILLQSCEIPMIYKWEFTTNGFLNGILEDFERFEEFNCETIIEMYFESLFDCGR